MKTKERILYKALDLFNEKGVKEVTLRQIAHALKMSQGNLNYHFKHKGDIISALYFKLVDEMNADMEKMQKELPILSFLYRSSYVSMSTLFRYKFLMMDLYSVLNSDETLKRHYLELQSIREQQYLVLFQAMSEQGLIRKEELVGEYARLHKRMNILGDNWINASLFFLDEKISAVDYYHPLLFEVIYPYLTKKGKEQYIALVP